MHYGLSRKYKNVYVVLLDEPTHELDYNKKYRWLSHYSYTKDYQNKNEYEEYTRFYFDEPTWKKLIKKKYMMLWMLAGTPMPT
jgi:hypothetical protein